MGKWQNPTILIAAGFFYGLTVAALWPAAGRPASPFFMEVYRWQTLIAALVALTGAYFTVRAIRAQIEQSRREFRHQMKVATARNRAAADREITIPIYNLRAIVSLLGKVEQFRETNNARAKTYFGKGVFIHYDALEKWYQRPGVLKERMNAAQTGAVLDAVVLLATVGQDDPLPTSEVIAQMRDAAEGAVEALEEVHGEIQSDVPE